MKKRGKRKRVGEEKKKKKKEEKACGSCVSSKTFK